MGLTEKENMPVRRKSCHFSGCPFSSIFPRCHGERSLEYILEIVGVIVPDLGCDLCDCHVGIDQKVLRLAQPAKDDIFHRGKSDFRFEEVGEVIGVGMDGSGDIVKAQILPVIFVNERTGTGYECRHRLIFGNTVFAQESGELCQQSHGEIVGDFDMASGFLLNGLKKMKEFLKGVFCRLDRRKASWQKVIRREIFDAQPADSDAIGAKFVVDAAKFIVNGAAVVENQIAFPCGIAFSVNHIDAGPLINKENFTKLIVFMHAARHRGSVFTDMTDIFEARCCIFAERRMITMVWCVLQQG